MDKLDELRRRLFAIGFLGAFDGRIGDDERDDADELDDVGFKENEELNY